MKLCLLCFPLLAFALEEPLQSGREPGERVPEFYVRAVTGPHMGKSVCYVCRHGDRPVVMVFLRKVGQEQITLLKDLDTLLDSNRASGLRGFGVLVTDDQKQSVSILQTASFDAKLSIPLTVASSQIEGAQHQNLSMEAEVTVVCYREQKVVSRFAYRAGELDDDAVQTILDETRSLAGIKEPD